MTVSTPVYVVTGASRGLGLEFVKQLLEQSSAKVVAAVRSPAKAQKLQAFVEEYPDRLTVVEIDVSSEASIKAGVASISKALPTGGVDVLINNAGMLGGAGKTAIDGFPDALGTDLIATFNVNVVGSYLLTAALLPLLRQGELKRIVNISTSMSSLKTQAAAALNPDAPFLDKFAAYRISKAAFNMETTIVANALKKEGFTVVALHPGWVETDMGSDAAAYIGVEGVGPSLTTPQSVAAQLAVIEKLTPAENGQFLQYDGAKHAW